MKSMACLSYSPMGREGGPDGKMGAKERCYTCGAMPLDHEGPEALGQIARDLLKAQEKLRNAYEKAVSGLNGWSGAMSFEDWGDLYWRIADNERFVMLSENAAAVSRGEDVRVVGTSHVWRPKGAGVVFAAVGNGAFQQVLVLDIFWQVIPQGGQS